MIKKMKTQKRYMVFFIMIAIFAIYDYRISLGIVLGYLFSLIHSKLIASRFNALFDNQRVKTTVYFGFLLDLIVLCIPIAIAMLLPKIFHFFGVFIGLMFEKYSLYFEAFRKKV